MPVGAALSFAGIRKARSASRVELIPVARMIRLAALQLRAHDRGDFERLRASIAERIERAASDHDLLVLPEGTFPAYVLGDAAIDDRLVADAIAELARLARASSCAIVAGAAVRRGNVLYNSAVVIDRDGSLAGSAEKIFLWHFDRQWFAAGSAIAPVDTSIGRLGVLICADGRMPGIGRELVDGGAELLVMPTAWVTSGRNPHELENLQADLLAQVRAFENGVPFIAAEPRQIEMAAKLRAPVIEIHTGAWCDAVIDGHTTKVEAEWQRIVAGAALARSAGLEVHAGHGLDYVTAEQLAALPEIVELNIGYYMIGKALFVGLGAAVRAMRAAMDRGRRRLEGPNPPQLASKP